jgi:hypothetical protein
MCDGVPLAALKVSFRHRKCLTVRQELTNGFETLVDVNMFRQGLFVRVAGLFVRVAGLFVRVAGLFVRVAGLFVRVAGLFVAGLVSFETDRFRHYAGKVSNAPHLAGTVHSMCLKVHLVSRGL